jgi:hypothetical protein
MLQAMVIADKGEFILQKENGEIYLATGLQLPRIICT